MFSMRRTALSIGRVVTSLVTPVQAEDTNMRDAARDSYLFTYPLVMMYRTMYLQAIDESSPTFSGGMGQWLHLGNATPADTDIVTPNTDTPYSYAWVDLRAEPWVLTMPAIGPDRFYTSQWDDLWGYVLDNSGSVNDGNDGVSVLLAGPAWDGDLPEGIDRVIQGETSFLGSLTRTQLLPSDTSQDIERIQASYQLEPLSAFLGQSAPPPAEAVDWLAWTEGAELGLGYWTHVAQLLEFVEPNDADADAYASLASIGIERGQPFDPLALGDAHKKALQGGIEDARALMDKEVVLLTDATALFGPRSQVGQKYLKRSLGIYGGIFGNTKNISVYQNQVVDDQGRPLNASNGPFEMTFVAGALPPVDFFWSLTMYKLPDRHLVDNPIDRYAISSTTPNLIMGADGSLKIYISMEQPQEAEAKANWLPAPEGPFWLVMRSYGPGQSILDKTYELPPVRAV